MTKKKLKVLFASFSPWEGGKRMPTNGMIEPMLSFFLPKTSRFVLIDLPHPGSDTVMPIIEIYKNGKLLKKITSSFLLYSIYPFLLATNSVGTRIPFKIRDLLAILDYGLRDKEKCDLFIGLESINALAGYILKRLGRVKKLVYYVSDFSPNRYKSRWFNSLYLFLDRLAVKTCDAVWDVSPAMMPARIEMGLPQKFSEKTIHVPNALFPKQISYLPPHKVDPQALVFAGTLGKENGPDLAVISLSKLARKFPNLSLHIFGSGQSDLARLQNLTRKLKLTKRVFFRGFFTNVISLSSEIKKLGIGLAPYMAIPGSPRWWADATKIRLYLAAGLPVITTQVPPLGKEIEVAGAGLIAKDNPQDFSKAIETLLTNKQKFIAMKKRAIQKAKGNTWAKTYSQALKKMLYFTKFE